MVKIIITKIEPDKNIINWINGRIPPFRLLQDGKSLWRAGLMYMTTTL